MASTTVTDNLLSLVLFGFIIFAGALAIGYIAIDYNITESTGFDDYDNGSLKGNMSLLAGDIEDVDDASKPTNEAASENPIGLVGKVMKQVKAMRNIFISGMFMVKKDLTFVPSLVWWFIGIVISIIIIMSILVAYWGQGIKQQ